MALKKKLSKAEFEALSEGVKEHYKESGDNYVLDVDGEEDTSALKRAKDREAQLRKDAETKLQEAQAQLDALGSDDARKRGDIETLEKSWKRKLEDTETVSNQRIEKLTAHTTKSMLDGMATKVASAISESPVIMVPHIRARLKVEYEDDLPKLRVLDASGQPSAMSIDDLQKEFVANKDFAGIITASKASGGAGREQAKPKVSGANSESEHKDLSKLSPSDMAAYITAKKEENA